MLVLAALVSCRRQPAPQPPPIPAPPLPQTSGTIVVDGLSAPVTVTRDDLGIPHIVAANQDDLFFAQGFVQAQDRLFQMDLWRRSVQGRLAEVLGSNFIERDAMTRRMQYRGSLDVEWTSYGADTKAIADAFTRGINAWIVRTGEQLPEEFALAGWKPELWVAEDLLNRTDAFLASSGADDELFRARLSAAVGSARASQLLGFDEPLPTSAVDLTAINYFVADVLRRVGTAPFFLGLGGPVPGLPRAAPPSAAKPLPLPVPPIANLAFAVGASRSATGAPLLAAALSGPLETPSTRYLVHLQAPGWNAIGATAPWRPGVAVGHNDRIAWSFAPTPLDTQDIVVERANPSNPRQVAAPGGGWRDLTIVGESVVVKGRSEPFDYERQYSSHGVVIAVDRQRSLAYTLRWTGTEPGTAAELGGLALARAQSWSEFRAALARWKAPVAEFVFADIDGRVASQTGGRVPLRPRGRGALPAAGWVREGDWHGWTDLDRLTHTVPTSDRVIVSAPNNPARLQRLAERLAAERIGLDQAGQALRDTIAWNANRLIPLLQPLQVSDPLGARARERLLQWDRQMRPESPGALLYVAWEHSLLRRLGSLRISSGLLDDFVTRGGRLLVPALTGPASIWFDGDAPSARDALLRDSLTAAVDDERRWIGGFGEAGSPGGIEATWGSFQQLTFRHPLAISPDARRRYGAGPFAVAGYPYSVFATGRTADRSIGPMLELVFDLQDWDRSRVVLPPGQSAAPDSPRYIDQVDRWRAGEMAVLPFSQAAIAARADSRLTLVPAGK